ncbi:hypothetical protein AYO21_03243 [Fonsecaea monophora]|uniref:Major facilitator superfamily (MFS) profile domain-containing protein n=1 Tax=Fonsecaea monophora TaxID=254056 RepID=A0A177FEQ6_9EURO|nr:hypothetical protein AYO21_03243 [Fonsecaea monophora]OAG42658.1 hypothetical protein AYO21_03243 [Fonsecaea monophora]
MNDSTVKAVEKDIINPTTEQVESPARKSEQEHHHHHVPHPHPHHANIDELDVVEITTKSPYREINFYGTFAAVTLAASSSFGGFLLPATSLTLINADIGPSSNYTWAILAWNVCLTAGGVLVGRLSDIFGRRWFFTSSSLVAIIGHAIGATANNMNQIIAASVFIGLAASAQSSFNYVLAEIVPVKHRFYWMSLMYCIISPISGFGAVFARLFIVNTSASWRWIYYFFIINNFVSLLLWFFFYHPPRFSALHRNRTVWDEVRDLDVGGVILYTGGIVLFTLGISWGGTIYPWKSAHVISCIIVGFLVSVAFVLYEVYMPLNRPLMPMHLWLNRDYTSITILTTVGGMVYFSINVIYPVMVAALFTTDVVLGGLYTCAIAASTSLGQASGSALAVPGGHAREKLILSAMAMTGFIGGMAGVGQSKVISTVLVALGSLAVGLIEGLAIGIVTVVIDQKELGVGGGVFGSVRTLGGVLATAIFSSILTNKLTDYTKDMVVPAALNAGLPTTSLTQFLTALASGSASAISAVPGVTPSIIASAVTANKAAYAKAFQMVFYSSIPFGVLAVVAACFGPKIEDRLTHDVIRRLEGAHLTDNTTSEESIETAKP